MIHANSYLWSTIFFILTINNVFADDKKLSAKDIKEIYSKYKEEYFEHEKDQYADSDLLSEGFFRVFIFDGYIFLPNRYVLIAGSKNYHQFNSFPTSSGPSIDGSISIGDYKDYTPPKFKKTISTKNYTDPTTGLKIFISEYEISAGKSEEKFKGTYVVIHDNEQYISISDGNEDLWRLILSKFEK